MAQTFSRSSLCPTFSPACLLLFVQKTKHRFGRPYRRRSSIDYQQVAVLVPDNDVFWLRACPLEGDRCVVVSIRNSVYSRTSMLDRDHAALKRGSPGTFQAAVLLLFSCRSSAALYWRSSERLSQRSSQRRWPRRGQNSWITCAAPSQPSTGKRAGGSCRLRRSEGLRFFRIKRRCGRVMN